MMAPGVYTLASLSLTTALSANEQTPIANLEGMTAVTLEASFKYGSGGESCAAIVQTTPDGGENWRDLARFDFAQASLVKHCNLEGLLSKGVTVYADLDVEGVYDGVLFDRLRCVVSSTGNYAETRLTVRAGVR